jgi:iron complex outermembrane receptor protein
VNVYSEQTRTVYSQNIGQTRGYGLQLSAGLTPLTGLRLFGALSYSRSQFSEDVRTNNGAWLPVQGKQLPDVPRWMANLGAAWQWQGLTVAPSVNYVGSRWGTSTYTERLPGYLTADLNFSYAGKARWGGWELGLSVLNVFDRRYIGQISTSEINTASNGAIYYPGAPRTVVGKVKLTF